jgi:hypothetical protein
VRQNLKDKSYLIDKQQHKKPLLTAEAHFAGTDFCHYSIIQQR